MSPISPRLRTALAGISGILVTPFNSSDHPAPARLAPIIARCAQAGVDALTVNGNTSEFYSLSIAEAERMQAEVPALIAGRTVVIAGVGRSLTEAAHLAARARNDGGDAVMVHQPPDPFTAPRGVIDYVHRVADAAELPVVLYLRNDTIGIAAIETLCALPGVVAVKWATPNIMLLAEAIRRIGSAINFVCGLAEPWAPPMTAIGTRGFTSGLINIAPERSVAIRNALAAGDYPRANAEIAAMEPFEALRREENSGTNVSVVKTALALSGIDVGPARPPAAWPLTQTATAALRDLLGNWNA